MCGIAGVWTDDHHRSDQLLDTVKRMSQLLAHRGPDDSGAWIDAADGIALGHRRLSIIDLSSDARQPMTGPSRRTSIVFNGEIYNYRELRSVLIKEGVSFRNSSDTEVILALYERYGIECLQYLRGMFAFALWDAQKRRLLLARDRLGKKPLYYASLKGQLLFASEIKALREAMESSGLDLDQVSLDQYLSYGFISGPRTIYRGITQLPPATVLIATAPDRFTLEQYWKLSWSAKQTISFADAVAGAEKRITEAVHLRLRADVPVGMLLSGGIDSGLVTAIASKLLDKACPTFTVGFEDGALDERLLAAAVAMRYDTEHHEVVLHPNVADLLPSIAWAYDQPFADASAVPSFCLARFVREQGIKVVLNGDGGDELFGGYRRSLASALFSRAACVLGEGALVRISRLLKGILPQPRAHRTPYALWHRFLRGAAEAGTDRFLIWSSDGFTEEERTSLCFQGDQVLQGSLDSYLPTRNGMAILDHTMALDLNWMLPYAHLVKMDIASMAHGLEARSPLLDHELVEWATALPNSVRFRGFTTKPLLRALAWKYLPAEVCEVPKRGFEPPVRRWLTGDLRAMRDDLVLDRNGLLVSMFERRRLERFLQTPTTGDPDRWATLVWTLLMLAVWDHYVVHSEHRISRQEWPWSPVTTSPTTKSTGSSS